MTDNGLDEAARQLVHGLAVTSRAFAGAGLPPGWPDTVPAEVALRLAEKSYRRGVMQGAVFMTEEIALTRNPGLMSLAVAYIKRLEAWRNKGNSESWANGESPP